MDRTIQPEIQALKNFHILSPVRTTLPNGVPLTVVNAGEQELVRMDILFAGGRWQQSQKLQALFTNRMLREGTQKYTAATIAEKLDYYGSWLELSSSSEYAYITVYSLNNRYTIVRKHRRFEKARCFWADKGQKIDSKLFDGDAPVVFIE